MSNVDVSFDLYLFFCSHRHSSESFSFLFFVFREMSAQYDNRATDV